MYVAHLVTLKSGTHRLWVEAGHARETPLHSVTSTRELRFHERQSQEPTAVECVGLWSLERGAGLQKCPHTFLCSFPRSQEHMTTRDILRVSA